MAGYPIELQLRGRTVLIVGFGAVGRRKAKGLLEAEARVVAVDPNVSADAQKAIRLEREPYTRKHLVGVSLVFASATVEVNRVVVQDARTAGIWVNSASDPDEGDVSIPSVWRDGGLTVAVSTGGASPALARGLRDRLAATMGPAPGGLAAVLSRLRPEVLSEVADPNARRRIFLDFADPRWLSLWTERGLEGVRDEVLRMCQQARER